MQTTATNDDVLRAILTAPKTKREAALNAARAALEGTDTPALAYRQAQLAKVLNVSRFTIRRMTRDGILRPVNLRGTVLYPVDQVRSILAGEVAR
jgi:hypothetical protein